MLFPRLLLIVFIFVVQDVIANQLAFKNLSIPDGLSNLNITSIAQDDLGYMWIGTRRGLNRYNGYEFTHFIKDVDDNNSLYSNNVNKVYCLKNGAILIGTTAGLNMYNPKTETMGRLFPNYFFSVLDILEYHGYIYIATFGHGIFRFKIDEPVLEQLGDNWVTGLHINSIHVDNYGVMWIALLNGEGLASYNESSNAFQYYKNNEAELLQFSNSVLYIHELPDDILILGTQNGLHYFDLNSRTYIDPLELKLLSQTLSGQEINFVFKFDEHEFWAGSKTDGLFCVNTKNATIINYSLDLNSSDKTYSSTYNTYFIDKIGDIWFGTFDNGININFKRQKNFNFDRNLNNLIKDEFVTSISKDHLQRLLIATRRNGYYIYDSENRIHKIFNPQNSDLAYPFVRSLLVDSNNRYWLGSGYYLQIFEITENFTCKIFTTSLLNSPIVCMYQHNQMIFAGTESQGLWIYDLHGNVLFHSNNSSPNIPDITSYKDNSILFIGYGSGIFAMNPHDFSIEKITVPGLENNPGIRSAVTLHYDKEDKIWIGTYNHGLIMVDVKNSLTKSFGIKDGLPSSDIVGILEDDNGRLWLSTSYGLARMNKSDFSVQSYSYKDALNNYQFHEKAIYKDENGILYFGGNNGLTYFNPADITKIDSISPAVIIDELTINNVRVLPSSCGFLDQSITYTDGITLDHRKRIFSIGYVGFDYYNTANLKYYYMLEGFDDDWNYAGSQRRVSYSNLRRGSYTFKAKVINDEGMGSELPTSLYIKVNPAPWFSYFAWVLYVSVVIVIVMLVSRMYIKSVLVKNQLELEQVEHRRDLEINDMKRRFFTNIAHEFRTPLTLLGAIFKQIRSYENTPHSMKEFIQMAGLNVERLLKLVNQLLAFKMMESDVLHLWVKESNLNQVAQAVIKDISVLALEKDVKIHLFEDSEFMFHFDADIVEKIMINLLSNAVKHSLTGGNIEVMLNKLRREEVVKLYDKQKLDGKPFVKEYIEISVIDYGKGIDPDKLIQIFDRYIKSEAHPNRFGPDHSSIGIGLNFSRKLVELHKGMIRVQSSPGKGAAFSFVIPYDSTAFEVEAFAKPVGSEDNVLQEVYIPVKANNGIKPNFKKTVLIIEDDPQLNAFLRNSIGKYYHTIVAYNGEEGLHLIKQKNPDVIVSDIVMPTMSGLELLKIVRESDDYCHLTVILLSSKSEISEQIEGLRIGADSYIPKPFDIDYLIHTIDSQLKNRGRIHEIFLKGKIPELKEYEGNQVAMNFIARLDKILEENLSNTELDITFIAEKMHTSRSSFYRKFLCMTNLTPISYVRKYRIQKSIELLTKTDHSIQIVSDMVGFSSPSYFSRAFKQEKNVSPKEYIAQLKKE